MVSMATVPFAYLFTYQLMGVKPMMLCVTQSIFIKNEDIFVKQLSKRSGFNPWPSFIFIYICLTSVTRAKPKEKKEFPA